MLVANESVDSRLREGVLGVDMEKACDHVNLNFLFYKLGRCGLGER